MKKLVIPILVGALAAFLNWQSLHSQLERPTVRLTRVARAMSAGETFQEGDLRDVAFGGDLKAVAGAAIPFEERSVLVGRAVPRDLAAGDLVLWRDSTPPPSALNVEPGEKVLPISLGSMQVEPRLLAVGLQIGFLIAGPGPAPAQTPAVAGGTRRVAAPGPDETLYVGPFRLLSIGSRLSADDARREETGNDRLVTVAIRLDPSGRPVGPALQLVQAIDQGQGRGRRIVAIVLDPSGTEPRPTPGRDPLASPEVARRGEPTRTGPRTDR